MAKKKSSNSKSASSNTPKKVVKAPAKKSIKKKSTGGESSTKGAIVTADAKPKNIRIGPAKGRPMLQWVGKKPLTQVLAFPAQHIETFDPRGAATKANPGGLLFHGDNKEVLAHLLANGYRGKVDLIYIDPPFDSAADYVRTVQLRGNSSAEKLSGEAYEIGEQVQYTDIWANDNYLQFMFERLTLLKELLSHNGSIVIHADSTKGHQIRCLLDEVFGSKSFRNEITWRYVKYQMGQIRQFVDNTDRLYWYSKGEDWTYNLQFTLLDQPKELLAKGWDKEKKVIVNLRDENGKTYKIQIFEEKIDDFWSLNSLECVSAISEEGERLTISNIAEDNAWLLPYIAAPSSERTGFPTQKPLVVLERVIRALSHEGALVLDAFIGSGTTAVVAQKLGRRWIGCDINKGAIQTTSKRLQNIIAQQVAARDKQAAEDAQSLLPPEDDEDVRTDQPAKPAQLHFSVYRVNDYDLQIQHNEAVAIACEHIGVTRTKSDQYFDGQQGKKLVKIIPFNHPLSPADLEQLKDELKARPDEERDILLVCLGKEFAADAWLDDWNRLRRKGDVPNRIQVIELRTDPKYGKFIEHKPASAKVDVKRKGDSIHVEVKDFISPTIIERLEQHNGLLKPQIDDFRSMIDCLMIDTSFDGTVFDICLSDIPSKKTDLIDATYELPAPDGKTTVAVKIIDMLGEEVLVTKEID